MRAGLTLLIAQSQLEEAVDTHVWTQTHTELQVLQKLQGSSLLSHTHIRCFDVCVPVGCFSCWNCSVTSTDREFGIVLMLLFID